MIAWRRERVTKHAPVLPRTYLMGYVRGLEARTPLLPDAALADVYLFAAGLL